MNPAALHAAAQCLVYYEARSEVCSDANAPSLHRREFEMWFKCSSRWPGRTRVLVSGREPVQRAWRVRGGPAAAAAGEIGAERGRVKAVDHRVAAGVQVPEHEEQVMDVLGRDLQHLRLEPVPDAQQIVGRPADHERQDDDDGHLQRLHPGLRDHVCAAASQRLACCRDKLRISDQRRSSNRRALHSQKIKLIMGSIPRECMN